MKAYFCAIATWFNNPTPIQSAAGVAPLAFTLHTGYNIPESYMIGALRRITYINVCISCHVHCAARLTVYFSAAGVCVRVNHDE